MDREKARQAGYRFGYRVAGPALLVLILVFLAALVVAIIGMLR